MLVTRNQLAFPAGFAPGFDPNHVAAKAMRRGSGLLAVATAKHSWVNLLTGAPGVNNSGGGAPMTGIFDGAIGPGTNFTNNGNDYVAWANSSTAEGSATFGLMVRQHTTSAGADVMSNSTSTNGLYFQLSSGVTPMFNFANFSSITLNIDEAYFLIGAAHVTYGARYLAMSLTTGKLQTSVDTTAISYGPPNGTVTIGSPPYNSVNIDIAAASYTSNFMSMAEMLKWAADPWSLWYPNV